MKTCSKCNFEKKSCYFTRSNINPICRSCRDKIKKECCISYRKDNKKKILQIYTQSKLPYYSMTDENFKKCWALENLQPLEASENIRKSNRLIS